MPSIRIAWLNQEGVLGVERTSTMTRFASGVVGLMLPGAIPIASAQMQVGDNLEMKAGGLLTSGYAGDYGDQIQSSHGLNFGVDGTLSRFLLQS